MVAGSASEESDKHQTLQAPEHCEGSRHPENWGTPNALHAA